MRSPFSEPVDRTFPEPVLTITKLAFFYVGDSVFPKKNVTFLWVFATANEFDVSKTPGFSSMCLFGVNLDGGLSQRGAAISIHPMGGTVCLDFLTLPLSVPLSGFFGGL